MRILFEDAHVLVLEKPAGLLVHATNEADKDVTLAGWITQTYPAIKTVGENPLRPGIMHRLDKFVSGVMVIARTQESFEALKKQFQEHTIEKEYIALVYGRLPKDIGEIHFPIGRSKEGKMVARASGGEGKEATTHYEVVRRFKTATLVRVKIITGRTHQIRVHFHAIGHPVVGDTLHTRKMRNIRPIPLDRLFLHASKLSFHCLEGTRHTVESPLPGDLENILKKLPVK